MADRRMLSKSFIDSDLFLDMPQTSQLLYFHLNLRADDDGFIDNPKSIARNVKCSEDDLKILAAKGFIIPFESGIIVITHWKIHNYIKSDRYKETRYLTEKAQLQMENNTYLLTGTIMEPECLQSGTETEPQDRDKDRDKLGKSNNKNNVRKHEAEELFERVWKLYQNKKGKGQVSDTAKLRLLDIGYEELERAIQRYKQELDKDEWRKPQNGSTFFNSGYIDYLDKNYQAGGEQGGTESESSINIWQ